MGISTTYCICIFFFHEQSVRTTQKSNASCITTPEYVIGMVFMLHGPNKTAARIADTAQVKSFEKFKF